MRRLPFGFLALGLTLSCGGVTSRNPGQAQEGSQATGAAYATGGAAPTGGSVSSSGGTAGDAGTRTTGAGKAGEATVSVGAGALEVLPSTGCGKDLPANQVETIPGMRVGYTEFFVDQTGATLTFDVPSDAGKRQFFVRVPADYDKNRPYRVVYIGSGCTELQGGKVHTYPLFDENQGGTEQAVYVGLSVPQSSPTPGCYDNSAGAESQEWEAFDLIHTLVESTYCVDNNRIYVAGYSTGGWLANMWGCYFAGTPTPPLDQPDVAAGRSERKFAPHWALRGALRVSGSLPPNQPVPCNGPAAGLWIHDTGDRSNLLATNIAAFNLALASNGCRGDYESGPKQPWAPAEQIAGLEGGICQQYTGCPGEVTSRYPLVFCTTSDSQHGDQSARAIPAFTQFLDALDPVP